MARIRSSTFQGSPLSDVEIDQLTFKRVVANAIGDTALVEDILTGEHTPPTSSTIDHRGRDGSRYRGCPLGAPLIQCVWPRAGGLGGGPNLFHTTGAEVFAALVPFYLPRGERYVDVIVDTDTAAAIHAEVYTPAMELVSRGILSAGEEPDTLVGRVSALTGGTRYIFALHLYADTTISGVYFNGLFVGFLRQAQNAMLGHGGPGASPFVVPTTVVTDGGGNGAVMNLAALDESLVADKRALSSFHLSRVNQNQNALEEYLTGAPAAANGDYALVDSDAGSDPTTSAFHDHSQGGKSNEPLVDFPLWAEPFGGVAPDGTLAGFGGTWDPPGHVASDGTDLLASVELYIPDGPNTDGTSILEVVAVICSPLNFDIATSEFTAQCFGASGKGAKTANLVRSDIDRIWVATISSLAFEADRLNRLDLSFQGGGNSGDTHRILGAAAYLKV